ncbi:MAG: hypothetical protein IKJ01_00650 [Lachnospiraceae bacterium]|nr:hypothetical protein [Lachnospiraceae bacterium]
MAQIMMRSHYTLYIDKPMYYYFQRESSITHNYKRQLEDMSLLDVYKRIIQLYQNHNIDKESIQYVIRLYVYHCGNFMNYAIQYKQYKKYYVIKQEVTKYKTIYEMTNEKFPERIKWLNEILNKI